jgi:hypothetical protein
VFVGRGTRCRLSEAKFSPVKFFLDKFWS